MNHSHNHSCVCAHDSVKFCKHCNTVYCLDCNKEWSQKSHWVYGTGWTYTYPYYTNQAIGGSLGQSAITSASTLTGCSHK